MGKFWPGNLSVFVFKNCHKMSIFFPRSLIVKYWIFHSPHLCWTSPPHFFFTITDREIILNILQPSFVLNLTTPFFFESRAKIWEYTVGAHISPIRTLPSDSAPWGQLTQQQPEAEMKFIPQVPRGSKKHEAERPAPKRSRAQVCQWRTTYCGCTSKPFVAGHGARKRKRDYCFGWRSYYSRVPGDRNHCFWPSQRVSKHTLMKSETQPASVVSINH